MSILPHFAPGRRLNNTLVKGMRLLETLAHCERPAGVTELARQLGFGKSLTHRLLQGWVALGYVRRVDPAGTYAATLRLWQLGSAVFERLDIRQIATPYMTRLLGCTRETVHLSVLDGDEVVYIHKLDSPEPVRAYSEVGGRAPAWCVATGKALLAWQDPGQLDALSQRLVGHSSKTITDPAAFLREMERIRNVGFAGNRGEWREEVCGVAAPVRDPAGQVIAAIGVSGPVDRLRPSRFKALSVDVIAAADGISSAIGAGGET